MQRIQGKSLFIRLLSFKPKFIGAILLLAVSSICVAEEPLITSPVQLLQSMSKAQKSLNYELSFVQMTPVALNSFRYRHLNLNGNIYAQLSGLDGGQQEILQKQNLIAYFNANVQPFSIQAESIIDGLPSVIRANFTQLNQYYDFTYIGRNRIADRIVQGVRILPKDNFRYEYVLFIDEETHLAMRADMLDRDGNLLEQFRVVNLYVGDPLKQLVDYLDNLHFPPVLPEQVSGKLNFNWFPSWLPQGFNLAHESLDKDEQGSIESRLYSDGLFSFNIYVANRILPDGQENVWKQGAYTIYSETIGNKEITLIGQVPLSTAKRIVKDIKFK